MYRRECLSVQGPPVLAVTVPMKCSGDGTLAEPEVFCLLVLLLLTLIFSCHLLSSPQLTLIFSSLSYALRFCLPRFSPQSSLPFSFFFIPEYFSVFLLPTFSPFLLISFLSFASLTFLHVLHTSLLPSSVFYHTLFTLLTFYIHYSFLLCLLRLSFLACSICSSWLLRSSLSYL